MVVNQNRRGTWSKRNDLGKIIQRNVLKRCEKDRQKSKETRSLVKRFTWERKERADEGFGKISGKYLQNKTL